MACCLCVWLSLCAFLHLVFFSYSCLLFFTLFSQNQLEDLRRPYYFPVYRHLFLQLGQILNLWALLGFVSCLFSDHFLWSPLSYVQRTRISCKKSIFEIRTDLVLLWLHRRLCVTWKVNIHGTRVVTASC